MCRLNVIPSLLPDTLVIEQDDKKKAKKYIYISMYPYGVVCKECCVLREGNFCRTPIPSLVSDAYTW